MKPGWPLIEGAVLAAVGLFALAFQLWLPGTHVAEADYQAVARVLEQERQPGDAVLLAPWWTERARIYVPDGLPVVGYQGSDGVALERHPRVWVLAQPRQPNAGLGAFWSAFLPARTEVGSERRFGNLSLRLFTNGRARPVTFDGAEALARAQVYLEGPDGSRQPCGWNGQGHRCPNGRTVGREWHEVHFAPYDCVRLDAPGGPTKVVVEYADVPPSAALELKAGYIWEYGAHGNTTPSTLLLEVNGAAQPLVLETGNELLHDLQAGAGGGRVRLSLSSQNPQARVVCAVLTGYGSPP